MRAFGDAFRHADTFVDPLQRELFTEIAQDGPVALEELFAEGAKNPYLAAILDPISNILVERLSEDERQHFFASIWLFGARVARASGGFLGIGRVSKEEHEALLALSEAFDLDAGSLKQTVSEMDFSYKF